MMFAMARDNSLPFSSRLSKVDPKRKTPVVPAVVIGVLSISILLINIRQPQIFTVITSIAIIMIYLAYLLVTVPMLLSRLRGRWPVPGERRSEEHTPELQSRQYLVCRLLLEKKKA